MRDARRPAPPAGGSARPNKVQSPRISRICAEAGARNRPLPAEGVRGRSGRGDMFGRGSYAIV